MKIWQQQCFRSIKYLCLLPEKIAEATRKFAALQSDLSRSVAQTADVAADNGVRRRHGRKLPMKGSVDKAVHKSMHDIKLAFSEFYLSLILLQNYQTLNFTGFRKILKKHDKVRAWISIFVTVLCEIYLIMTCSVHLRYMLVCCLCFTGAFVQFE